MQIFPPRSPPSRPTSPAEVAGVRADLSAEVATVKADLSAEIAGVRADNAEIRNDLRRMDDRLRAVEIAFGKVDQRLETLERLHRPDTGPGE